MMIFYTKKRACELKPTMKPTQFKIEWPVRVTVRAGCQHQHPPLQLVARKGSDLSMRFFYAPEPAIF